MIDRTKHAPATRYICQLQITKKN